MAGFITTAFSLLPILLVFFVEDNTDIIAVSANQRESSALKGKKTRDKSTDICTGDDNVCSVGEIKQILVSGIIGFLNLNWIMWLRENVVRSYDLDYEDGEDQTKFSKVKRNVLNKKYDNGELRVSPLPGKLECMNDILEHSVHIFGEDGKIIWYRDLIDEIEEDRDVYEYDSNGESIKTVKKWKYYTLSEYKPINVLDFIRMVHEASAGIATLGLKAGDNVMIYARTSYKWILFAHSCWRLGIVIVTAYETLDEEGLISSIKDTEVKYIFVDRYSINGLVNVLQSHNTVTLDGIILSDPSDTNTLSGPASQFLSAFKLITLDELSSLGKLNPVQAYKSTLDDTCCIMYTSGTSKGSKGVEMSNKNIISAISGSQAIVDKLESKDDGYLAYLPLSHVLECVVVHVCIAYGIPIGFGSVWTITDLSVRNCENDIKAFKPSLMSGVPAVWEGMKRAILTELKKQNLFRRTMFHFFFHLKWQLVQLGIPTTFIDKVIFRKIRTQLGGKLRFVLNGGAPINPETKKFITVCAVDVINGYGLTETAAMGAVQFHHDKKYLVPTGPPTASVEIKLGYEGIDQDCYSRNKYHSRPGEIYIRGAPVMKGYYKMPELTKSVLFDDGWFRTGDVGVWTKEGFLQIIDRIRNLVKLPNGEYISLEKLDSIYKASIYVENICILWRHDCPRVIAIISPVEKSVIDIWNSLYNASSDESSTPPSIDNICKDKAIIDKIFKDLIKLAQASKCIKVEIPARILITPFKWTPESGFLTAAFKVARYKIEENNKTVINALFNDIITKSC